MDLKEKLKALGIGVTEALVLTLIMATLLVTGINWVVEYYNPQYVGFLANLLAPWLENPLIIGVVAAGIRSLFGWLENFFGNGGETYDPAKLAETWTLYIGLVTLFSQGLPIGMSVVLTLILDLIVRAIKTPKATE